MIVKVKKSNQKELVKGERNGNRNMYKERRNTNVKLNV